MSATLDKIMAEVKALPPAERQQLRDQLDALLSEPPAMTEDEFERYLAAKGVIAPVGEAETAAEDFRSYQPITVGGQPLSEMIIEERR